MPNVFVIVCEAKADFVLASCLTERVLCESVEWLQDTLTDCNLWFAFSSESRYLRWDEIPELAARLKIRAHGFFGGNPGKPDAHNGRKALLVVKRLVRDVEAILFIRDIDQQGDRRIGLVQAREHTDIGVPIVIGLAHAKRENWVLAGFDPLTADERSRFDELRTELGCNPCTHAHELTATKDDAKNSAKRVLALLTNDNPERESKCWTHTPLDTLRERGIDNGLSEFLTEIRTHLVPLVTGQR